MAEGGGPETLDPRLTKLNEEFFKPDDAVEHYNIEGYNAHEFVLLQVRLVNSEKWASSKTFQFNIREIVFKIKPNPTENHPGNGWVTGEPKYDDLVKKLNEQYKNHTDRFAGDLKKLFHDNTNISKMPGATRSAYILLLFEIARRLVRKGLSASNELDSLPIGIAVGRLIILLSRKACTFEEAFQGKLYCFGGEPGERKQAIHEIESRLNQEDLKLKNLKKDLEEIFKRDPPTSQFNEMKISEKKEKMEGAARVEKKKKGRK